MFAIPVGDDRVFPACVHFNPTSFNPSNIPIELHCRSAAMNPWMMIYIGGTVAASTARKRIEAERQRARSMGKRNKHNQSRPGVEAQREKPRTKLWLGMR
jgi:hypothetical protein